MPDLPARLPSALVAASETVTLGPTGAPALVAHPDRASGDAVPLMLWMHGRTVSKEIDPGRYLRWIRAGIGVCAIDLPGHGDRFDAALQEPERTLDVVLTMAEEIDGILEDVLGRAPFDPARVGIGGMSAGGMATLTRLTHDHPFRTTSVEGTTGSWRHQMTRAMFEGQPDERIDAHDPIRRVVHWREIPFQAFHSEADEWVDVAGQRAFVDALRAHANDPEAVEFVTYERTGAPAEHAGFGRFAADAKDRQRDFLVRTLAVST